MTEVTVRRDLMKTLQVQLPDAVAIRHEDLFTTGIPDLSISYAGQTSWWEIKYADPSCTTTKLQQHLCSQLAAHGFLCRYIIFRRELDDRWPRQIRVCTPTDFQDWQFLGTVISEGSFDYQALVDYIIRTHTS